MPYGMEIAGSPARFAETVKMSERYIVSGSLVFSPSLNAGVGVVGPVTKSADAKTRSKSFLMTRRVTSSPVPRAFRVRKPASLA